MIGAQSFCANLAERLTQVNYVRGISYPGLHRFGALPSIGARIGALATPGEVLVSGTLRDLVLGPASSSQAGASTNSKAFPAPGACSPWRTPRRPRH